MMKPTTRILLSLLAMGPAAHAATPEPEIPVHFGTGTMAASLAELSKSSSRQFLLGDKNRPGAWCWFQDERVIVDNSNPAKPTLLTGVVTWGPPKSDKRGDIDLYWLDLASVPGDGPLVRGRFELDDRLQMDDHASPAFMIRPDGRYLVTWSMHGNDPIVRSRISTNPGDPTSWSETRRSNAAGGGVTYTNPKFLAAANGGKGVIFNGIRSRGFDSNYLLSDDLGETWRYGGRVLDAKDPWPKNPDGGRAYVKYTGDGKSKIHIFTTDDHPRVNFNETRNAPGDGLNSIYYAYIENNQLHRNDGTVVDDNLSDEKAMPPTLLTCLLKDGTLMGKDALRRGWQLSLNTDDSGQPVGIFQFRANDNPDDHRYFYARRSADGQWLVSFLAYGGDNFGGQSEKDYTGLAAVDPANPDTVFISTSSHPVTNEPLISATSGKRQNEIFMGKTRDGGKSWTWAALTKDSKTDNLRPIVPRWTKGKSVVLWMKGDYPKFYDYNTLIMGQMIEH